jgi:hypothetical protein
MAATEGRFGLESENMKSLFLYLWQSVFSVW